MSPRPVRLPHSHNNNLHNHGRPNRVCLFTRSVSLPPAPDVTFWSEQQWTTLFALADAVIPSIRTAATVKSSADKVISTGEWDTTITKLSALIPGPDAASLAKEYLEEDVSSNPIFRATVQRIIGNHVHEEGKNGFGLILNALK